MCALRALTVVRTHRAINVFFIVDVAVRRVIIVDLRVPVVPAVPAVIAGVVILGVLLSSDCPFLACKLRCLCVSQFLLLLVDLEVCDASQLCLLMCGYVRVVIRCLQCEVCMRWISCSVVRSFGCSAVVMFGCCVVACLRRCRGMFARVHRPPENTFQKRLAFWR